MQEMITFDDVLIKPKFSSINSRKDVYLGNSFSVLPIVSANMDTITGAEMASAMLKLGGIGCLHRFWSIESNCNAFLKVTEAVGLMPWVSVGINDLERAKALYAIGASVFVLDVAHGAQIQVVKAYEQLKLALTNATVVVGNFATHESVNDFLQSMQWHDKPDMVKIGIGPGSACTTRLKTGCGVPQLSAIMNVAHLCVPFDIPIIADGGMRTSGDIAKALAAGATMVMLGGMLAGTNETPGEIEYGGHDVIFYKDKPISGTIQIKKYRGSASKEAYSEQGKVWHCSEGESFTVPYKGPVSSVLADIEGGLRSAFSYVGASNLKEFQEKAEFIRVSANTIRENGAHGK